MAEIYAAVQAVSLDNMNKILNEERKRRLEWFSKKSTKVNFYF